MLRAPLQQRNPPVAHVTKSDMVDDMTALNEFQVREEIRRAKFAELKGKIQVGIDQLDRGETVTFNLESFLAARHAEHAAR
jgi:hypothetical protein